MADTVTDLTPQENADFAAICPHVRKVTCRLGNFDTAFGVGIEFDDGKRVAFVFDASGAAPDRRPHTLATAADRAWRWYRNQAND